MEALILNPIVLSLLVAIGIIALVLLYSAAKKKKINLILRQFTIFLFLFTGLNILFFPFVNLYPEALAADEKTLISALLQITIYALFVFILRTWFAKFFQNTLLIFKNPFLGALLVYLMFSWIWSDTPLISFKLGIVVLLTSALSAHFASDLSWVNLFNIQRLVITIATVISLVALVVSPSYALIDKGLTGILPYPIRFGTLLSFGISLNCIHLISSNQDRWKTIGMTGLLAIVLPFTNSAQAFVTCFVLVNLVIILKLSSMVKFKYIPMLIIFYLIISILFLSSINFLAETVLDLLGKDPTLSGRTEFWPQLFEKLSQRPLLGYGMGGFWQPFRGPANPANGIVNSTGFIPPNAHSGFLDLTLQLGLIGFSLFCAASIFGFVQAIRFYVKHKSFSGSIPLIILVYIMLANVSETQLIGSNYIWILYVITLTRLSSGGTRSGYFAGAARQQSPILSKRSYPTSLQNLNHN